MPHRSAIKRIEHCQRGHDVVITLLYIGCKAGKCRSVYNDVAYNNGVVFVVGGTGRDS